MYICTRNNFHAIPDLSHWTQKIKFHHSVHAPILEARLAFGASRYEAAKPLAIDAIRVSVIPIITQLSVMGLINIPGMMTGQLMAGMPMLDAVIYQQAIMFMIAASSTLGAIMAVGVSNKYGICLG